MMLPTFIPGWPYPINCTEPLLLHDLGHRSCEGLCILKTAVL